MDTCYTYWSLVLVDSTAMGKCYTYWSQIDVLGYRLWIETCFHICKISRMYQCDFGTNGTIVTAWSVQCKINPRSWTRKATKLGYATLLNILWLHHYVSWGPRLSSLRGTIVDPRVCWLVYLVSTVWTKCAGKSAACHICFSLKTIINSRVTQIHNVYIS